MTQAMKQVCIMLPAETEARIRADAKKTGLTLSGYVRRHILGRGGARFTDTEAMNRCTRQMAAIWEKTAELCRLMNGREESSPEQIEALFSMYRKVEKLVLDLKAGRK